MIKVFAALLLVTAAAAARPVVFRVSDPINPGETALLYGDGIGSKVSAEGWRVAESGSQPAAQNLSVLQASEVSAKVVIPMEWKPGLFAVRLRNDAGVSDVIYLNRTEPWWWVGGEKHVAFAGEEIRLFGKNFGIGTTAWLVLGKRTVPLAVKKAEKYTVRLSVPDGTPLGQYQLWASNGFGGQTGRGEPLPVTVERRTPWPSTVFNVRDFGAMGNETHDDTPAFRAALDKAQAAGGGVVFIPRGTYQITGKLSIPPYTVLRGEKREVVWLYVPKETPEFDVLLAGNHDFAIEDLSLVAQTAKKLFICPDQPIMTARPRGGAPPPEQRASNVHLRRLRLHDLRYAHRVLQKTPDLFKGPLGASLSFSGDDIELADSEVVAGSMPFAAFETNRLRIERNQIEIGRNGFYLMYSARQAIVEGNVIEGRDLEASYGGFQEASYQIYYAHNTLGHSVGGDRESLTFDTPYYPRWMGKIGVMNGRTLATRDYSGTPKLWKARELKGDACLIAYGKGLGQYIPIVDNTETTITLARDWAIPPDETSHIVVRVNRADVVVTGNHFSDSSVAVQLYAQSYGIIIDGNRAERTGGTYGISTDVWITQKNQRRYSTCMFNQWLDNDLSEGFIYQQGPWPLSAVVGPAMHPRDQKFDAPAVTTMGNIVRNNRVKDNYTIGALLAAVRPFELRASGTVPGYDTIIEGNTVTDSPLGIAVYTGYQDTVVRNNKVERCTVPLSDDGVRTWLDPGARLRYQVQAVREQFGITTKADDLAALWKAVAGARSTPVSAEAAGMLIGLRCEVKGSHLRLRTELWAPAVTAEAGGRTAKLESGAVEEFPAASQATLNLAGIALRVALPAGAK